MTPGPGITPPVHVAGPAGPWDGVREGMRRRGNAVVVTTRAPWLDAVGTGPRLRLLLGRDWPRYRRIADPRARDRFAAARLVLKHTAAAALGTYPTELDPAELDPAELDPAELDLAYKTGGRPHLRGLGHVDVGLSHTGELIVVGISREGRIGVDAEPLSRALSVDVLRRRMCTPAERAFLNGLDAPRQTAALLRLWTLKEAYTKALGQGLRLRFDEFGFPPGAGGEFPGPGDGLLTPEGGLAEPGAWTFGTYRALERYRVAVAHYDRPRGATPGEAEWAMAYESSLNLVAQLLPGE
ncbi:4'-phosphopantetheinyl transferase superfamily protein [Streptomyces sp. NPDC007984]|uniref:4'-phosphopantetheinyl transferase family protein n=1 Tax=Streptomyces sp. NPDC007984 TaxID=3364801 RepID=UPI0036DFCFFD